MNRLAKFIAAGSAVLFFAACGSPSSDNATTTPDVHAQSQGPKLTGSAPVGSPIPAVACKSRADLLRYQALWQEYDGSNQSLHDTLAAMRGDGANQTTEEIASAPCLDTNGTPVKNVHASDGGVVSFEINLPPERISAEGLAGTWYAFAQYVR